MPTHFPATYSSSERGVARPSEFYSMTARDSGWRPSAYPRGVSNGGPRARNRRGRCARTRRNCCSPPVIPTRKPHRPGGPCRLEKESLTALRTRKKHLRSVFDSATLTANAGVEISGSGRDSRGYRPDSAVNRGESHGEPAQTFGDALRG